MQADRWKQIERTFHAALEFAPESRPAFLAESCGRDEGLRRDVERLLSRYDEAGSFLEEGAVEFAARTLGVATLLDGSGGTPSVALGDTILHYRIIRVLGSGGMGVVFEAEDLRLRRHVALKVPFDRYGRDLRARNRFEHEARAASSLNHPNICSIHAVEEHGEQLVIVMELLEGESLKERLCRGAVPTAEVVDLAVQAARAIQAAHFKGIIHRDIKPANLFLTADRRLKVLDFGLAKTLPADGSHEWAVSETLTREGAIAGTTAYMSPEQARGEQLDGRSDLFSLGVVLYEVATGVHPFVGRNTVLTIDALLNNSPPSPSALNPEVPAAFDRVIMKLIEKDRERRYQQAAAVLEDLSDVKSGTGRLRFHFRKRPVMIGAFCLIMSAISIPSVRHLPLHSGRINVAVAGFDMDVRSHLIQQLGQESQFRVSPLSIDFKPGAIETACRGASASTLIEGSMIDLEPRRLIGLRSWDCATGNLLHEVETQAASVQDVPAAITDVAHRLATKIQDVNVRAPDPATAGAALKAFSEARKVMAASGARPASLLFRRAIELDPGLAIAYAYLARCYGEMDQTDLAAEFARTSWRLRDRATESDRFFIDLGYVTLVSGNLDQAQQLLDAWVRTYPDDPMPHGFLASHVYRAVGQFDESTSESRKALELKHDMAIVHYNLAASLSYAGRLAEARNVIADARKQGLDIDEFLMFEYDLAFLTGDAKAMESVATRAHGRAFAENWVSEGEARTLAWNGHLRQARNVSDSAAEQARHSGQPERAGLWMAGAAVREAFFGNSQAAASRAVAALTLSASREVEFAAAFAFAASGDTRKAMGLTDEMEKRFPNDTAVTFYYLPVVRARLALNTGDSEQALRLLALSTPVEKGMQRSSVLGRFGALYPAYVRGQAYLAAGRGAEAVVEFRKVLAGSNVVVSDPVGIAARLQLARALSVAGDKRGAREAYMHFLENWRNADDDIPILLQARAESAEALQTQRQ